MMFAPHGSPAVRDVPDGDLHAWYVTDYDPYSYLVMPPAIGGGRTAYRVFGYYDAHDVADRLNAGDATVADEYEAVRV